MMFNRALHEQIMLQWSDEYLALWRLHTQTQPQPQGQPDQLPPEPTTGFRYRCAMCGVTFSYPTHYCSSNICGPNS